MSKPKGWNPSTPKTNKPSGITPKVNLRAQDFDNLIRNQGVKVKVYRTIYCPLVKSIDGAEHEVDCPLCHGDQFLDRLPIETWAFIQSQATGFEHFSEGIYDGNTVSITFLQGIELQYFTLVELCDFTDIYLQRVKRQEGMTDVLRYKGHRVNLLVDSSGKEYYEGSDFQLDTNGNVCWKAGKGPNAGQIYSIHYETSVKFRATKAMHANRFANVSTAEGDKATKMNEQWLCDKVFLVTRKTIDGQVIQPNKIRDSDED